MAGDLERSMRRPVRDPGGDFVQGPAALEVWAGRSEEGDVVSEGTGRFIVTEGRIAIHTVHYHVHTVHDHVHDGHHHVRDGAGQPWVPVTW